MIAGELVNMEAGRPKENPANLRGFLPDELAPASVSTEQAAEMLNVSTRSVETAKKVIRDGVPELADAVKAGEIAVSAAAEIAKAPAEEQAAIVGLPADQRVEVLKAKRAEAKAIRAALPTKSEAKRIAH